jgi:hypothetical protein
MMLPRSGRAAARKGPVQQLGVGNKLQLHPSPIRKRPAAGTTHLVSEKLDRTIVNPIIMRLDDARFVAVDKLNQPLLPDRSANEFINIRRGML